MSGFLYGYYAKDTTIERSPKIWYNKKCKLFHSSTTNEVGGDFFEVCPPRRTTSGCVCASQGFVP